MTTSFVRYLNETVRLTPPSTIGTTTKNCLLIGQRNTLGTLIPSLGGNPQPNYYEPFLLPSFPDGTSALQYLAQFGIQYTLGINFSLSLPAPSVVSQANNLTTLTWATVPANFLQLTDFALSGTLSQTTPSVVNGNIYSAKVISGVATLVVYGTLNYDTAGGLLTLSGVDNVNYPDPELSDPIALMVWDFYQTALTASPSANGTPAAYISLLSNRDDTISPSATPIVLGDPTAVTTGTTSTLTYPIATVGLGYLPTTSLGATTVIQSGSGATGTFDGYVINGSTVIITVTSVTGTFTTTDAVTVTLDSSQNVFQYLNNIDLYAAVMQFPIDDITDITTTYADFYDGVAFLNQANQVLNKHYFTYAVAGNITSLPTEAALLPAPNTQYDILPTYPYVYKFGNIPYDNTAGDVASGRISSAVIYMLANGDAPFPPLTASVIPHLPVSSVWKTTSYSGAQDNTGDIAINQGWLPLAPNSSGVVSLLESNTSLITIPDTSIPDIEFRYTHIWDCIRWIKREVAVLFESISVLPNNAGTALISQGFLDQFKQGIIGILTTAQNQSIIKNLALYKNLVTVTQDLTNPNQVDAYIPCQIIPQLNGADIVINVFSSLVQFNQQGAQ